MIWVDSLEVVKLFTLDDPAKQLFAVQMFARTQSHAIQVVCAELRVSFEPPSTSCEKMTYAMASRTVLLARLPFSSHSWASG